MMLRLDLPNELGDVIARLASRTGLSKQAIIRRLLSGHIEELHELDVFLEEHAAGADALYVQAANLLQSYGPESVTAGLRRIAPRYETLEARFQRFAGIGVPAKLRQSE